MTTVRTRYDLGVQMLMNSICGCHSIRRRSSTPSQFRLPAGTLCHESPETPFTMPRDTHAFFLNIEFRY